MQHPKICAQKRALYLFILKKHTIMKIHENYPKRYNQTKNLAITKSLKLNIKDVIEASERKNRLKGTGITYD